MPKCQRQHCGGSIALVMGEPSCVMCGHSPDQKTYPEPTDVDLKWMANHARKAARMFPVSRYQ